MTDTTGSGELDDVMQTTEGASRARHEHGGYSARPDDDLLQHRTEEERVQAGIDDYDPGDVPPATD